MAGVAVFWWDVFGQGGQAGRRVWQRPANARCSRFWSRHQVAPSHTAQQTLAGMAAWRDCGADRFDMDRPLFFAEGVTAADVIANWSRCLKRKGPLNSLRLEPRWWLTGPVPSDPRDFQIQRLVGFIGCKEHRPEYEDSTLGQNTGRRQGKAVGQSTGTFPCFLDLKTVHQIEGGSAGVVRGFVLRLSDFTVFGASPG
jgi:hypothetical protein